MTPVLLLLLFVFSQAGPAAAAQDDGRAEREEVDPYTEGDAEVMEALGLRRFAPFRFGGGQRTSDISQELGGVPILWVETEHFQLGCTLEPMSMPEDPAAKKRLRAELKELSKRLPNVPRRPKELDPWLVLHLYAARLEALYDEFVERLQLEEFAEQNPYLGMDGPLCVFLTEKKSTFARYTATACDMRAEESLRFAFTVPEERLFFGIALESLDGDLRSEGGLHFAVVHGVTRVLADAVRGYGGTLPVWFSVGLGHWFARECVDDEILLYTTPKGEAGRSAQDAKFAVKVRGRVENGVYATFEKMESWSDPSEMRFPDHMVIWSKVDYLLRSGAGDKAHAFLWGVSEPIEWDTEDRDRRRAELTHSTLVDIAGGQLDALDQAWSEWVLDEYPKR